MRIEDLDLVRVLVPAGAGRGDDEPGVRQAVQVRPAGSHRARLGEFDMAVRMDGDDQGVEGVDIAAGLGRCVLLMGASGSGEATASRSAGPPYARS
ncbi:hypothetical protein ABZ848_48930 [Streptomyces sp. NPDC047081]|uniref:hypothetical protein n=1 Tax=Streptomyces sp. NPDC047081 TaxID=3154706 RepID=UPI0034088257